MTKRMLSAAALIKEYSILDPLRAQRPTDTEIRDAMQRVQADLEKMVAPYRASGWAIIDIPEPQIRDDGQSVGIRGYVEIERDEGQLTK